MLKLSTKLDNTKTVAECDLLQCEMSGLPAPFSVNQASDDNWYNTVSLQKYLRVWRDTQSSLPLTGIYNTCCSVQNAISSHFHSQNKDSQTCLGAVNGSTRVGLCPNNNWIKVLRNVFTIITALVQRLDKVLVLFSCAVSQISSS